MYETLQTYWPHILFALGLLMGIPAAIHAAMTKDDVRAAIGWVGIILLSPVLGAIIYAIAGVNRIRRDTVGKTRISGKVDSMTSPEPGETVRAFAAGSRFQAMRTLGDRVSPFWLTEGNDIEILHGGDEAYPAIIAEIDAAKRYVVLSSYIFDNDPVGRRVADALARAVARGVEVRVLIDAVGARYSRPSIREKLREGRVPNRLFLGNIIGFRLPYANLRNHRKIMVVDGSVGFTGGMNIRQMFATSPDNPDPHRDTHFRITGPVVAQIFAVFANDWFFVNRERLDGPVWRNADAEPGGSSIARVIFSGPDRRVDATHAMVMGAAAVARERLMIASP
ncbi:MAG: phospholipase D-like domain-containing protein, partial [Aliihoeflea sp.]